AWKHLDLQRGQAARIRGIQGEGSMPQRKGASGRDKAPKGCFWRGNVLWAKLPGDRRVTLRTDNAATAASRRQAIVERQVAIKHFGDHRITFDEVMKKWGPHLAANQSRQTVKRYLVSIRVLRPYITGLYLDEVDHDLMAEIVEARQGEGRPNSTIK